MASIVPNKNLFIVTSALEPRVGVITKEDRFNQTIATLNNLKEKVPEAIIFFTDGSPVSCDPEYVKEISKLEPYFDTNGQLIHNLINRLAVDSSRINLIKNFLA